MSAPKRKQPHTTVWLRPRATPDPPASFRNKAFAHPGARAAFQKLTQGGIPEELLWRHLWGLAWLQKACRNQKSPSLPGLLPRTLRRFPDRVRRMADEIEGVDRKIRNDSWYCGTVACLPVLLAGALPGAEYELRGDGKVIRDIGTEIRSVPAALARGVLQKYAEIPKLTELPRLLRLYANYLEVVDRLTAHGAPKGAATLGATMPLELVEMVKKNTGQPHINDIATLLEAAYYGVGIDKDVDPHNLTMLYRRRISQKK
jgi:hypothetical protein